MNRPPSRPAHDAAPHALHALRARYQAASANTIAAFRRLAAQLAANPGAAEVIETLRRELHRVHGTAGTYGFLEASRLAALVEDRVIRWAREPAFERERRAAIIEHFASALEVRITESPGSPTAGASDGPAAPPAAPSSAPPSQAAMPAAPAPAACPDVIIVEDDPALADMLQYALGTSGFSFSHFATGSDALAALLALEAAGRRPVILLDVDLPGLDGFSLHERLRVERPGAFATVFLTARAGEAEQLRAYRAGALDYLPKPVNMRILMAKIPGWLDRVRRAT